MYFLMKISCKLCYFNKQRQVINPGSIGHNLYVIRYKNENKFDVYSMKQLN